jgi:dienelactone hydrolase
MIAPRHFTPPPPYAKANAFREVELRVQAPGGPELLAILALPALASASGPVPGALLLPGDGAFDVDGTAGANKPLRDIAQGLAASGIATLRVERRAHALPEDFAKGTAYTAQQALVDDALAALALLREQEAVDASSISIIGHGLGGWLAPTLAAQDGTVQRLVLLVPHGADLGASLARQARRLAQSLPEDATQARAMLEEAALLIPRAESGALDPAEGVLGHPGEYWRTLLSRRPAAALSAFKGPVLLAFAEGDHVVDEEDRESWAGLVAEGSMLSQSRAYEGVNHFLVPTTENGPEGLATRGNVSEPVVRDIAGFLLAGRMP